MTPQIGRSYLPPVTRDVKRPEYDQIPEKKEPEQNEPRKLYVEIHGLKGQARFIYDPKDTDVSLFSNFFNDKEVISGPFNVKSTLDNNKGTGKMYISNLRRFSRIQQTERENIIDSTIGPAVNSTVKPVVQQSFIQRVLNFIKRK